MSDVPALILREPWKDAARQRVAAQFGMWSFLATETLFFGAMFLFYAVAHTFNTAGFVAGARHAEVLFGTVNAAILLTSSVAMTVAERAAEAGFVRLARAMFTATIALGCCFLLVKGLEYRSDLEQHLFPGPRFALHQLGAAQFWTFYWVATAVHAVHLTIGLGVVGRLLLIPRADLPLRGTSVEVSTLYWHYVDMVWVLLYPLLYLVGR